uniref:Sushi domain-containing protein n=1 Tax=Anopheles arabiensis TaxID=7173 RepID=A0A182HW60_ANOAR
MSTNAPHKWGPRWSEHGGGGAADGRIAACRRHAPRYHLSTGRQMIVLSTLTVLFVLTASLPAAMGHQRSYSIEPTASNASDGTTNRTASTLTKRTAGSQTNGMVVPLWSGPTPIATSVPGRGSSSSTTSRRRNIRPRRIHHTGVVRSGRSNTGGTGDQVVAASTHRHHSKSIDRRVSSTRQQQPMVYKNLQQGSITLEMGSHAFLAPDQNRTLTYLNRADSTVNRHRAPSMKRKNGRPPQGYHHRVMVPGHLVSGGGGGGAGGGGSGGSGGYRRNHGSPLHPKSTTVGDLCISCPPERTAIARKGLDGVLIEPPCLSTCNGRPISKELYELETLFGPRMNFILPHSNGPPYSFMAKVVSKQTGSTVLTCDLRYRVIVKQCKRYKPKNRDLKVSCSLENIWGSRCTFHCRSGGYLSRPNSYVECGENELWEGEEPYCIFNDVSDDYAADSNASNMAGDCQLDIPPENGRFACDLKENEGGGASNELSVPNGTACQVTCNEGFHVPAHLQPATFFGCNDGQWNNTMRPFCYKPTPIPGSSSQRRRGYG